MDNRIFNVNGEGDEALLKAIELACLQAKMEIKGWKETKSHGLILCWVDSEEGINKLPIPMTAKEFLPIAIKWLESDFAKEVELSDFCTNNDHDGHNEEGWQVYCEDWGHVGDVGWRAICAIKPAFLWYGK